jgi:homoserine kinase
VRGDGGQLPHDPAANTASVAAAAVLAIVEPDAGVELELDKGMPLRSGLGGSAASAVAGAVATMHALGASLTAPELLACALAGERAACGAAHPDNAAASLMGGLAMVRSTDPIDLIELPVPTHLVAVVVHPRLEIDTGAARALIGDTVPLAAATAQWANTAALVAALYSGDDELLGRALEDRIAEPHRARLVPGFAAVRAAALDAGALACGLSGSGPSLFALCSGRAAGDVRTGMLAALQAVSIGASALCSRLPAPGARVVEAA